VVNNNLLDAITMSQSIWFAIITGKSKCRIFYALK